MRLDEVEAKFGFFAHEVVDEFGGLFGFDFFVIGVAQRHGDAEQGWLRPWRFL